MHPVDGNSGSNAYYLADLDEALEIRGVPTGLARETVDEVDSHLQQSGSDPETVFGSAAHYASTIATPFALTRFFIFLGVSVVWASVGGWLLSSGLISVQLPIHEQPGLPGTARLIAGAALIAAFVLLIVVAGERHRSRNSAPRR